MSHVATSIEAARMGMGFAWFPEERTRPELEQGLLRPLPLDEGLERFAQLYLVISDPDFAGPGTLRLAAMIRESVAASCPNADDKKAVTARVQASRRRAGKPRVPPRETPTRSTR